MHELRPKPGNSRLSTDEIIALLQQGFAYVVVDRDDAVTQHNEMIASMEDAMNRGAAAYSQDQINKLRAEDPGFSIVIADSTDHGFAYLWTVLSPDEPLRFGYESQEHEDAAKPLLQRVAHSLGYEIELH